MSSRATYTIDCDPHAPKTVASYLRVSKGEAAIVETNTQKTLPSIVSALEKHHVAPEAVKYIVVTHVHLDHAGGASALLAKCPNATILAHPRAARHIVDPSKLVKSATAVYGAERFAQLYGVLEGAPEARVKSLEDGESFELGGDVLSVVHTRGHANHHFVVVDPTAEQVFTGDSFGMMYPQLQRAGTFALASTSPTDFDAEAAHASIDRIAKLGLKSAYPTHFGEVRQIAESAEQLHDWIDEAARWLDDATKNGETYEVNKERIEQALRRELKAKTEEIGLTLNADDWRLLATDIDLNAQGIAFVADRARAKAAAPVTA